LGFLPSRADAVDSKPPTIEHQRITEAPLYEQIEFRVQINDESSIFAPSLYYRYVGEIEYRSLEMKETTRAYLARIDGGEVTGDIEYFLEAFDEHGNGPARDGSPKYPIRIAVGKLTPSIPKAVLPAPVIKSPPATSSPNATERRAQKKEPVVKVWAPDKLNESSPPAPDLALHTRWWFWTSMVVALAAGGTAAAWALQPDAPEMVRIRVIGPDPYGGLP